MMRYGDAGVNIERAAALKPAIANTARASWTPGVRRLPGGFAGIIEWPASPSAAPAATGDARLLLAATMDGVGTKLLLALAAGRVADAAADLVYHGANDLLVHGARPLALLDYVAQSRLDPDVVLAVIEGLTRACRDVGAALLGGETAEMPDTYLPGALDLAGCMMGTVAAGAVLDGSAARPGDALLGLTSNGLHTNGYSLARRIFADSGLSLDAPLPGGTGERVGDALLAPLFAWLQRAGAVPEEDARAAFNLGIGMIVVCAADRAEALAEDLRGAGETVYRLGDLVPGERAVEWIES